MDKSVLIKEYINKKKEIKKRLSEFSKKKNEEELFLELCYCLLVPLSKAERVYEFLSKNKRAIYLSEKKLAKILKGVCRFHNLKAKYIVEARKKKNLLREIPRKPETAREFLVRNFKGIGYKEASHFLRNIGYKGLAILDKHIISSLYELGVIKNDRRPRSKEEYLEIEKKMKNFSKKIGINIEELDLLLWSMKTGEILK